MKGKQKKKWEQLELFPHEKILEGEATDLRRHKNNFQHLKSRHNEIDRTARKKYSGVSSKVDGKGDQGK
jgi:hypothetical protein